MSPNLGINDQDRASVVKILNALRADEYVLYTKTRNYHWNVVGPQFNDPHKFFAEQYEAIDNSVDDVAERARTLGGHAVATLGEFVEPARLKEHPGQYPSADDMLENLLSDHETLIRQLSRHGHERLPHRPDGGARKGGVDASRVPGRQVLGSLPLASRSRASRRSSAGFAGAIEIGDLDATGGRRGESGGAAPLPPILISSSAASPARARRRTRARGCC